MKYSSQDVDTNATVLDSDVNYMLNKYQWSNVLLSNCVTCV